MNILVISKPSIPAIQQYLPDWKQFSKDHELIITENARNIPRGWIPDAILSMSVSVMEETFSILKRYPGASLYSMCWDVYEWVWKNPRPNEYNYKAYGQLLEMSREIWVPSECTGKRVSQWYGLDYWKVVKSSAPYFDHDNVRDGGYAYCALREIPDKQWDWFERGCKELKIPYKMTQHNVSMKEYRDTLAGCRFIVSHCYELSTGGLSLVEGYYLGKPCLLSDSKWHGGRDYMGDKASYFGEKYEYFLMALDTMYRKAHQKMKKDHKEWVIDNYSDKIMCDNILRRLECYHNK